MATSLSSTLSASIQALYQNPQNLLTAAAPLNQSFNLAVAATKLYAATRTTSGETLDLTSGLTDIFGNALVFSTVVSMYIQNLDPAINIVFGGGTNPVFAVLPSLIHGGGYLLGTTLTVDGTHKNLLVAPASGTPSYNLIIVGS